MTLILLLYQPTDVSGLQLLVSQTSDRLCCPPHLLLHGYMKIFPRE